MDMYSKEINGRLRDGTERALYKPLENFLERFSKEYFKMKCFNVMIFGSCMIDIKKDMCD